ncbi:hypothetical protein [Nocardia sp. NPDC057668]|uniref:hypothetical protein n=1 Tax=Nocardia sp. NPDC057668 TaxID=3346202 RepID=UPI00366CF5B4
MKSRISKVAAFVGVATLALGLSGCSADQESSAEAATSTSAAAAAPLDYATLLIKASDIDAGWTVRNTSPEQNGVTGIFGNSEGTEKITSAVIVRANADDAAAAVAAAKDEMARQSGGASFSPIDVGAGGGLLTAPGGTTVVAFSEGKAFSILEFNSTTGERVPDEVAIAIAGKQDAAIKAGLK